MKHFTFKNIAACICCAALSVYSISAQTSKELRTVIINNGDTLVNGKKIADLSRSEHEKVQKDFQDMNKKLKESRIEINGTGIILDRNVDDNMIIRRSAPQAFTWSSDDTSRTRRSTSSQVYIWNKGDSSKIARLAPALKNGKDLKVYSFNGDSLVTAMNLDVDSVMVKHFGPDFHSRMPIVRIPGDNIIELPNAVRPSVRSRVFTDAVPGTIYSVGRNNSQSFSYSNTDKNGITTRMNIRLNDTNKDELKKMTGSDAANTLVVEDLTLFPNFSTGKITLSFNLPGKSSPEVKLLDSDMKPVFTDKPASFSGNYIKQVSLPKNGVYYIAVSQNGKWFTKKMIKE